MSVETLSVSGGPYTILQNIVYALPGKRVFILADAEVQVSNSYDSGFAALTGSNTTGVETSAKFIKCTSGDTVVTVATDSNVFASTNAAVAALTLRVATLEAALALGDTDDVTISGTTLGFTGGVFTGAS